MVDFYIYQPEYDLLFTYYVICFVILPDYASKADQQHVKECPEEEDMKPVFCLCKKSEMGYVLRAKLYSFHPLSMVIRPY